MRKAAIAGLIPLAIAVVGCGKSPASFIAAPTVTVTATATTTTATATTTTAAREAASTTVVSTSTPTVKHYASECTDEKVDTTSEDAQTAIQLMNNPTFEADKETAMVMAVLTRSITVYPNATAATKTQTIKQEGYKLGVELTATQIRWVLANVNNCDR